MRRHCKMEIAKKKYTSDHEDQFEKVTVPLLRSFKYCTNSKEYKPEYKDTKVSRFLKKDIAKINKKRNIRFHVYMRNKLDPHYKLIKDECKKLEGKVFSGTAIRPRVRFLVLERDRRTCQRCYRSEKELFILGLSLHIDHYIPSSKGGKTEITNLQATCSECNQGKGDLSTQLRIVN